MLEQKLAFLERILGKARYHHNTQEAEFFSPFKHHHKPKLSINLATDNWRDWVTGHNGRKLIYVLKSAGASREDILEYIEKYKSDKVVINNKSLENINSGFCIKFPKTYQSLVSCKNSLFGYQARKYLLNRGISEIDLLRYKIGLAHDGIQHRIVFPSFSMAGNLNFYTARASSGHYTNQIDNQKIPRGYKSTIVLNEINIDWKQPVVLTEGFVDMLKSVRNTVPLFGSSFHEDTLLFEKLITNNTEVVLALDSDAWQKSEKMAKKLFSYDLKVSTMDIGNYKDLGEKTKEENLQSYENRVEWSPEESFIKRIRMI